MRSPALQLVRWPICALATTWPSRHLGHTAACPQPTKHRSSPGHTSTHILHYYHTASTTTDTRALAVQACAQVNTPAPAQLLQRQHLPDPAIRGHHGVAMEWPRLRLLLPAASRLLAAGSWPCPGFSLLLSPPSSWQQQLQRLGWGPLRPPCWAAAGSRQHAA
jgi:hypothetical protein